MDPNVSYYSIGYLGPCGCGAGQLFTYPGYRATRRRPQSVPDLATEIPTAANGGISDDGKTYTIKLRDGAAVEHQPGPAR